jgi:hypothetical protein
MLGISLGRWRSRVIIFSNGLFLTKKQLSVFACYDKLKGDFCTIGKVQRTGSSLVITAPMYWRTKFFCEYGDAYSRKYHSLCQYIGSAIIPIIPAFSDVPAFPVVPPFSRSSFPVVPAFLSRSGYSTTVLVTKI